MTKLERQIAQAMKELLEEGISQETEKEVIKESRQVESKKPERDSTEKEESRRLFRRWRKQAGI